MIVKLPDQAVSILRRLQAFMLEEPRRVNMRDWGSVCDPDYYPPAVFTSRFTVLNQRPPCGAAGCIAGNLLIMMGKIVPNEKFDGARVYNFGARTSSEARDILGVSNAVACNLFMLPSWGNHPDIRDEDGFMREDYFHTYGWPNEFEARLKQWDSGTPEYTQVIVGFLDHVIEHGIENCAF